MIDPRVCVIAGDDAAVSKAWHTGQAHQSSGDSFLAVGTYRDMRLRSRQSIVAAEIVCRVVMHSTEISADGFSTAGQSVQFRSRAKLTIT